MNPVARVGLLLAVCLIAILGATVYHVRMERVFSSRMVVMAMLRRDGRPVEDTVQFDPEATVLEIAHHALVEKRLPLFLENLRASVRDTLIKNEPLVGGGGDESLSAALARMEVSPETFVRMMDLPQMARILGVVATHDAEAGLGHHDDADAIGRGMHLRMMTEGMARNPYALALRAVLLPDNPEAELAEVREAARVAILRGLSEPEALNRRAWLEEVGAIPELQARGLYTVVGEPEGADAQWWREQIKIGLRVGAFENHLLPVTCELRTADGKRGIADAVLDVLAGMIEVEYMARGQGTMYALRGALADEIAAAQRELEALERDGDSAKTRGAMVARQLEGLAHVAAALRRGQALPSGWEAGLPDDPALRDLAEAIRQQARAMVDLNADIQARTEEARTLRTYLDAPTQQTETVRVRRVVKEDSARVRALREEKREKELECRTLLQRATPAHPMIRALTKEIANLQAAIELHDVPDAPVYEMEERTNSNLVVWRRDLSDLLGHLAGLSARREMLQGQTLEHIREMRSILEEKSASIRERRMLGIRTEMDRKERQLESLEQRATVGAGVEAAFEVYTRPLPVTITVEPSLSMVYGMALGVGCLVGLLLLLALGSGRNGGMSVTPAGGTQSDPAERLPILGAIHSFE